MNRFAALAERLESADGDDAARVLADYLATTEDPDRGLALAALLGGVPKARIGRAVIAALAERLDPELLAISREVSGDLAEAIALMWPSAEGRRTTPSLTEIVAKLDRLAGDRSALLAELTRWLDALEPGARVALMRLASGRLAGLIRAPVAQAALARLGRPLAEVETAWHADVPPYAALLGWAAGERTRPRPARAAPFRPLAPVRSFRPRDRKLDPAAHAVDHAWDGLRVLAIAQGGARRLYTRRGEDVSARFPELIEALTTDGALEGVILAHDREGRRSRAALEGRLARRPQWGEPSSVLIVHDLLELSGEDLRALPLRERRARLDALAAELATNRISVSTLTAGADWNALNALRTAARASGAGGVVLKRWDAPYAGRSAWIEWRCDPHTARAVLLYVEYGESAVTATLGAWRGSELVPVAKAELDDDAVAERMSSYVAEHRVERFGPVVEVTADASQALVVEVAFSAVDAAPRRKAGLLLREANVVAVHDDATPSEATTLKALVALLG